MKGLVTNLEPQRSLRIGREKCALHSKQHCFELSVQINFSDLKTFCFHYKTEHMAVYKFPKRNNQPCSFYYDELLVNVEPETPRIKD